LSYLTTHRHIMPYKVYKFSELDTPGDQRATINPVAVKTAEASTATGSSSFIYDDIYSSNGDLEIQNTSSPSSTLQSTLQSTLRSTPQTFDNFA
jgi:hypothetical protein